LRHSWFTCAGGTCCSRCPRSAVSEWRSAEEYLESGQVDDTACLITDVEMPGLNGIELQSVLAARDHRIPIIFITAYPTERLRQRIERAGACGFFAKPFDEESFIGCLRNALGDPACS
jgi:FixJ family two-component response regulator